MSGNVISFLTQGWGHRLHGSTMHRKTTWWDRVRKRDRYTVMVHSRFPIRPGDTISYMGEGGPRHAKVTRVKWCRDPHDMATLEILITPKDRA